MPDEAAPQSNEGKTHIEGGWRDVDLKRAIKVAEKSGLGSYRIEIAPDGTISIIVVSQAPTP